MKYIEVYYFNVIRELQEGNAVYILDKEKQEILKAATMRTIDLLALLQDAEDSKEDRYYFYKENEKGNEND